VKVNFLLVGHTHDHIDQMFSTFSKKLSRCDAFTLPTLSTLICESYTPKPEVIHLTEVYDFKRYAQGTDDNNIKVFAALHNISFNHVFLIKRIDADNTTLLYAKQYSSSTQWEPLCGCRFLLQLPMSTVIYGAKQMPYEDRKILSMNCDFPDKQQFWIQSLEVKRKHIEYAKRYAGNQDVSWWDLFFVDQQKIIDYCLQGSWPISTPFSWTLGSKNILEYSETLPDDLAKIIRPEQRDIYVGPKKSKDAEARWRGNLQEIEVGMLIATLAEDDELGHPFWIAKVLNVSKNEIDNKISSLKVHWYHTTCQNAFSGKYTLEMIGTTSGKGAKRRKKNVRRITTLNLEEVDVIIYAFTLTKSGHLRKSTISMIKEKLKMGSTEKVSRQTRSSTHNPADVGLHLDEDNALVNSSEEDESSYISMSASNSQE
jgi:hypothetical protein